MGSPPMWSQWDSNGCFKKLELGRHQRSNKSWVGGPMSGRVLCMTRAVRREGRKSRRVLEQLLICLSVKINCQNSALESTAIC